MLDNYKEQLPPSGEETDKIDYNQQLLKFNEATKSINLNNNDTSLEKQDLDRYEMRFKKKIDELVSELPNILTNLDLIRANLDNLSLQENGKKLEDQDNALLKNIQDLMKKIENTENNIYDYIETYNDKKLKNSPTNNLMNKSDKKDISTTKEVIDAYRDAPKFEGEAVKYLLEYGKIPTSKQLQNNIDKKTLYLTETSILRELHQFWNEIRSCNCSDTEVMNALGDNKIGKEIFDTLMDKLGREGIKIKQMGLNNVCFVKDTGVGAPLINTTVKLQNDLSGNMQVKHSEFSNNYTGVFVQNPNGENLQYVEYHKGGFIVRDVVLFDSSLKSQEFIDFVSEWNVVEKTSLQKINDVIATVNHALKTPVQALATVAKTRNIGAQVIRTFREIVSTPIEQEVSNQNNNDYHDDQP